MRRTFKIAPAEVSDGDIKALVKALDGDGSGSISVDELVEFVEKGDSAFFNPKPPPSGADAPPAKPAGFEFDAADFAESDRRFPGDPEKILVPPSRRTRGGFVGTGRFEGSP